MLLYLSGVGTDTVVARVDGRSTTRDNATATMAIDMNKVHIFDTESQDNLFYTDPS